MTLMVRRRGFLAGLAIALAAPAIVRASVIMPARTPLLLRVTHTTAKGFPTKLGVTGSTWHQQSATGFESRWVCGPDGLWVPATPIDFSTRPALARSEAWMEDESLSRDEKERLQRLRDLRHGNNAGLFQDVQDARERVAQNLMRDLAVSHI